MHGRSVLRSGAARRCVLAIGFAALVAPAIARGQTPAAAGWLPSRPGGRWEWAVHRDHTYKPADAKADRTFRLARVVADHLRTFEQDGLTLHEMRERRQEKPVGAGLPPTQEETRLLFSDAAGLRLHASAVSGGQSTRFDPPLQLVPADPVPGTRWRVGRWEVAGSSVELTGRVLGREDVADGEPAFANCLKLRHTGPVEGVAQIASGAAKIRNGRYERTLWLKEGVGVVREEVVTDGDLELEDGVTARVSEIATQRLIRYDPPRE
jgi:hypothetical protein